MEARATKRFLRGSPRKMRLVIDQIRGKSASQAMAILQFSPKRAAMEAERVLRSAVANLSVKNDEMPFDNNDVLISEAFVNQGPTLKRIQPAPMGRAYRVRKRSNHLTIVVSSIDQNSEE